jgi:hypothetical protein
VCSNIVQLRGATGSFAAEINGWYEPTAEFVNNASLYRKLGDADKWIEYINGKWAVKRTASRGKNISYANVSIKPAVALEECPIDSWMVDDGDKFVAQPSFSVSVSSLEAFQDYEVAQVVRICIRHT